MMRTDRMNVRKLSFGEILHDVRTVKAWRNGFRKFYCPECHVAWRCKKDAEQFVRDQEYAGRSGCLGVILLCVTVAALRWGFGKICAGEG